MKDEKFWWVKRLSHLEYTALADKEIFGAWENGAVGIDVVIKEFKTNNAIKPDEEINANDFREWLNSLGYWREVSDVA